jgi:hypothetical protein
MNKRPVTVSIIGWLLVVVGTTGFIFHLYEVKPQHALQGGNVWIFVVELVAIVSGAFVLRGRNWARWLALAWIAFHVVFSFFNSWHQVAVHGLILLLFAYALFRPEANAYFRLRETMGA